MNPYIALISGWSIYFFLHSFLASENVKNSAKKILKSIFRYYRLVYTMISTLGLLGMMVLNASMRSEDLFTREGFIRYISLILAAGGVIVIRSAFKIYKLSAFLGFSIEKEKFITSGILAHVRHPIYLGTILIAVGFWLFTPDLATLISVVCIFIYLPFGIYLEEKKLTRQFGKEYLDYKKKVPAIVPKLF